MIVNTWLLKYANFILDKYTMMKPEHCIGSDISDIDNITAFLAPSASMNDRGKS